MQVRGSNTLSVAMLDNGNYQVADGDGEAQTMTETQLNARIANQGFEVVDGDVFIGGKGYLVNEFANTCGATVYFSNYQTAWTGFKKNN